jgi:hypothetical protein
MSDKYAVIMETSGPDCESWYYFVKYEGNEDALKHLGDQLALVEDDVVYSDMSKFDIDLENFVTLECVNQMIMLELNSVTYHMRYDGKMKTINLGFKNKDKDTKRLSKIDDIIGNGNMDKFLSDEFIPESHRPTDSDSDSDGDRLSDSGTDSDDLELPDNFKIN